MKPLYPSFLFGVGFFLASCQGPMKSDSSPLKLDARVVGASETSRTSARDAYGKTEILSADGTLGWMSVAYISTNTMGVIADTGEAPRLFLKGWKKLKDQTLAYGQIGRANTDNGAIAFEYFSFKGNKCFHFHKLINNASADDMGRYRELLAGYTCLQAADGKLVDGVERFLNGISVPRNAASIYEKDALPITLFDPVRPLRTRMFIEPRDPTT